MKRTSTIIDMKRTSTLDGRTTYKPVRVAGGDITPEEAGQLAPPPIATEQLVGTHLDRAKGFALRTLLLGVVTGVTMWIVVGGLIEKHPLLSLAAGAYFFGGFLLVLGGAFILDAILSPSGVALYNARRFWNYIDEEQAERHDRMRRWLDD